MAVHAEMVPQVSLASQLLPEPLIGPVSQLEDLVQKEGEHIEEEEVERQVLYAVAIAMVDTVVMVLNGIENLVLDHPHTGINASK